MKRYRRFFKLGVFLLFLCLCYILFWPKSKYYYLTPHTPGWLESNIPTSAVLLEQEPGPSILSGDDSYVYIKLRFYDASTNEQIMDRGVLDELLSMFQYTDDPFVYSRERSENGTCYFYYDGILPGDCFASIFSGFQGKETFPKNGPEIENIYIRKGFSSISATKEYDLEKALDTMS